MIRTVFVWKKYFSVFVVVVVVVAHSDCVGRFGRKSKSDGNVQGLECVEVGNRFEDPFTETIKTLRKHQG